MLFLSVCGRLLRKSVWQKYGASAMKELRMYDGNADIDSCLMIVRFRRGTVFSRLGPDMRVVMSEEKYLKLRVRYERSLWLYMGSDLFLQSKSCAIKYHLLSLNVESGQDRANHPDSSASRAKLTGAHQETRLDVAMSLSRPLDYFWQNLGGSGQGCLSNHQLPV